ncbi:uncharacterized protein [Typha angustifolia]|uniref:uncharacterized protein n=1 Tax=Typha angustifolia TaxID=59011 RepID=UPI003C2AC103
MPQVDIESFVCGGDRKVGCETLADGGGEPPEEPEVPAEDPDLPPESIEITIGDEIDWPDINPVYDRDDSTKGSTNPKSNPNNKPRSAPTPIGANLKAEASIIRLPAKLRGSGFLNRSSRQKPPEGRIFPKKKRCNARDTPVSKAPVPEADPGSPKVSCIGKVLSDRERERFRRRSGFGCFAGIAAILRCGGGGDQALAATAKKEEGEEVRKYPAAAAPPANTSSWEAAPGLGGMKQFASGRRGASSDW